MKLLVVDPGPHVGVAFLAADAVEERFEAFITTPADLYKSAEGWVRWADRIVWESFQIGGQRGAASNETIEQIGILRYLCELTETSYTEQTPGEATVCTDKKLRLLGWWTKGPGDHARSATKHLVAYLLRHDDGFKLRMANLLSSAARGEEEEQSASS